MLTIEWRLSSIPAIDSVSKAWIVHGCRPNHWDSYKFCMNVAIRGDGVQGKSQLAAQGKPTQRGRNVNGNPVLLKHTTVMPMPGQQVFDAEFAE